MKEKIFSEMFKSYIEVRRYKIQLSLSAFQLQHSYTKTLCIFYHFVAFMTYLGMFILWLSKDRILFHDERNSDRENSYLLTKNDVTNIPVLC